MAGVAGPMLQRSKPEASRFLSGLLFGGFGAATLMSVLLFVLGMMLQWLVSLHGRLLLATAILILLGIADLANRTPHIWRQVPQVYVRRFAPGRLGVAWGFDLSLLFTTQKSTSLPWAALLGIILLNPSSAWLVLIGMTGFGTLAIAIRSVVFSVAGLPLRCERSRPWHAKVRRAAGAGLLVLAVTVAVRSG